MRILGVDPGLRITGYAVISVSKSDKFGKKIEIVEAGVIRTDAKAGIAERLTTLYTALLAAADELKPEKIVIEKLYAHYKHPATAILMGHARGVVCLVSGVKKIPLTSIASTQVKKAITGKGHASKLQVQRMIQHTLKLKCLPEPPDVADALAVALSYAFQTKL